MCSLGVLSRDDFQQRYQVESCPKVSVPSGVQIDIPERYLLRQFFFLCTAHSVQIFEDLVLPV